MKVTLFMATSLNGMIATKDYKEDFLSDENWNSFIDLATKYRNFIIGRKTYEVVKEWKDYNFDELKNVKKIVISADSNYKIDNDYMLANSPQDALEKLRQLGFKNILLTGGAAINSSFAKLYLLDEIVLNINPVLIGEGVSLFTSQDFQLNLDLIEEKKLEKGIIQAKYEVIK